MELREREAQRAANKVKQDAVAASIRRQIEEKIEARARELIASGAVCCSKCQGHP